MDMELKGKKIGIAFCGSFCTFDKVFREMEHLKETGAEIYPIFRMRRRGSGADSASRRIFKTGGGDCGAQADPAH